MGKSKGLARSKSQGNYLNKNHSSTANKKESNSSTRDDDKSAIDIDEIEALSDDLIKLDGGCKPVLIASRTMYPNGDIYEGSRDSANKMTAYGVYIWRNGDRYTGHWKENLMSGSGTFAWNIGDVYQGSWKKGLFDGYGEKIMVDGSIIKGTFRKGLVQGYAVKTFPFGDVYSGMYSEDIRCGYGQYSWCGGKALYKGMWREESMEGVGVKKYAVKKSGIDTTAVLNYDGGFINNNRQGLGSCVMANKEVYIGESEVGILCGWGKYSYRDGSFYEGEWLNGVRHGAGSMIYVDGSSLYFGEWKHDVWCGYGVNRVRDEDNIEEYVEYRGEYFDGKRHGYGRLEVARTNENGIIEIAVSRGTWNRGEAVVPPP